MMAFSYANEKWLLYQCAFINRVQKVYPEGNQDFLLPTSPTCTIWTSRGGHLTFVEGVGKNEKHNNCTNTYEQPLTYL